MKELKFRAYNKKTNTMGEPFTLQKAIGSRTVMGVDTTDVVYLQFTGITIRGVELYEGDIVEFTDKWEWYRGQYAIKMMFADADKKKQLVAQFDAEPMYRFEVKCDPFEGCNLSSYDLSQDRYMIIGNVYQHPELVKETK